jgi:DNA replication protein DnaC
LQSAPIGSTGWSPGQFLYAVCEQELEQRQIARQQRLQRGAHLSWQKGLDGFDHQHLEPRHWQELQGLARQTTWLLQAENLLLFGPSGVGKIHLAIAITMAMSGVRPGLPLLPRHHAGAAAAEGKGRLGPRADSKSVTRRLVGAVSMG